MVPSPVALLNSSKFAAVNAAPKNALMSSLSPPAPAVKPKISSIPPVVGAAAVYVSTTVSTPRPRVNWSIFGVPVIDDPVAAAVTTPPYKPV